MTWKPAVAEDPAASGFDPERLQRVTTHLGRYVSDGDLAGWQVVVSRHGRIVHHAVDGLRDEEAGLPVVPDTRWRIFSMTKPIVAVATMALVEQGRLRLRDDIATWLPAFAAPRVYDRHGRRGVETHPAAGPITVSHLLSQTSGLGAPAPGYGAVGDMHAALGFGPTGMDKGLDLAAVVQAWAGIPLAFEPGTGWMYGISTDVLGHVLEKVCDKPLDAVLHDLVLGPLGMTSTGFHVDDPDLMAALYAIRRDPSAPRHRMREWEDMVRKPPAMHSGGGGLVSTAHDYHRFTQMLAGGGALDGVRVLGPRTLDLMAANVLPGGADIGTIGHPIGLEGPLEGLGQGLGFGVVIDPGRMGLPVSRGELSWGGAASTFFWVDRETGVTAEFYTQAMPSGWFDLRAELRTLVYAALVA